MTPWIRLTKTDNRRVDVNLARAHSVLRDERDYSTLITFGPSDSVTVLESPDTIFGRNAADPTEAPLPVSARPRPG
jgi:hypothetical protein